MKVLVTLLLSGLLGSSLLVGCTTAEHAAEGATDVAVHAVDKTGRAVAHGARKVEQHL